MAKGKRVKYEENHKEVNGILYKKCTLHNQFFPDEDDWILMNENHFYKNKCNIIDGYFPYCKRCNVKRSGEWQKNNPEWHNENNRKYYSENRWNVKGVMRKNALKRRQTGKHYAWLKTAKGKECLERTSINRNKKNHKISNKEWIACKDYFKNEQGEWCCAYCGMTEKEHKKLFKQQLHKEHADDNGANDLSNCIPSCKICNSEKHDKTLDEWYNIKNPKFHQGRLDKIIKWLYEDYKLYFNFKR